MNAHCSYVIVSINFQLNNYIFTVRCVFTHALDADCLSNWELCILSLGRGK